jgi:hypothetical protein
VPVFLTPKFPAAYLVECRRLVSCQYFHSCGLKKYHWRLRTDILSWNVRMPRELDLPQSLASGVNKARPRSFNSCENQ